MKKLNLMQKRIMLAGVAIIVLMGLFPPCIHSSAISSSSTSGFLEKQPRPESGSYAFFFNLPGHSKSKRSDFFYQHDYYHLAFGRLLIQWFLVFISTAALMIYFKE